jgi:hypothetical protein
MMDNLLHDADPMPTVKRTFGGFRQYIETARGRSWPAGERGAPTAVACPPRPATHSLSQVGVRCS